MNNESFATTFLQDKNKKYSTRCPGCGFEYQSDQWYPTWCGRCGTRLRENPVQDAADRQETDEQEED